MKKIFYKWAEQSLREHKKVERLLIIDRTLHNVEATESDYYEMLQQYADRRLFWAGFWSFFCRLHPSS
jgi:hypothetical protein